MRRRVKGVRDSVPPEPFDGGDGAGGGSFGGSTEGATTSTSTMKVILVAPASYRTVELAMRITSPCSNQRDSDTILSL
jgi:hypothetical protein